MCVPMSPAALYEGPAPVALPSPRQTFVPRLPRPHPAPPPTSATSWPQEWLPGLPPGLLPDRVVLPTCFSQGSPSKGQQPSWSCPRSCPCASTVPQFWGAEAQSPECWYWHHTSPGSSSSLPAPVPVGSPTFSPAVLSASVRGAAGFPAHPHGMSWLRAAAHTLCQHPGPDLGAMGLPGPGPVGGN